MIIFGGRGFAEIGENQGAHRFGRIVEQRAIVTAQRRLADADVPGDGFLRIAAAAHRADRRQRLMRRRPSTPSRLLTANNAVDFSKGTSKNIPL